MRKQGVFWGCYIPWRLPFIEKSVRVCMDLLDVEYQDLEETTCCPEKSVVGLRSTESWRLTAARNLCLAEEAGVDVLTPCNGCYSTLKGVSLELRGDAQLKATTNEKLASIGKRFEGTARVRHFVELLHDRLGPEEIRRRVTRKLAGLRIAVFAGCHLLKPSDTLGFDNPSQPSKLDKLVEVLGARSVNYAGKTVCCGGAYSRADDTESATGMARRGLQEMIAAGAEALVVVCPSCFMQFDAVQFLMQRRGEPIRLPVFYYSELLAVALGIHPAQLGMESHRVDVTPILARIGATGPESKGPESLFDMQALANCQKCGACMRDCPVSLLNPRFDYRVIVDRLMRGEIEALVQSPEIWSCLECYTCHEGCPQRSGAVEVLRTLKRLSLERGLTPKTTQSLMEAFERTGVLAKGSEAQRKKLGLPPVRQASPGVLTSLIAAENLAPTVDKAHENQ